MGYDEDDMLDSPPTRGMPDVRALADALEPPPDMAALKVKQLLQLSQHSQHQSRQFYINLQVLCTTKHSSLPQGFSGKSALYTKACTLL